MRPDFEQSCDDAYGHGYAGTIDGDGYGDGYGSGAFNGDGYGDCNWTGL